MRTARQWSCRRHSHWPWRPWAPHRHNGYPMLALRPIECYMRLRGPPPVGKLTITAFSRCCRFRADGLSELSHRGHADRGKFDCCARPPARTLVLRSAAARHGLPRRWNRARNSERKRNQGRAAVASARARPSCTMGARPRSTALCRCTTGKPRACVIAMPGSSLRISSTFSSCGGRCSSLSRHCSQRAGGHGVAAACRRVRRCVLGRALRVGAPKGAHDATRRSLRKTAGDRRVNAGGVRSGARRARR
jgi:hypothetical protein